jgi:hypothetical protein
MTAFELIGAIIIVIFILCCIPMDDDGDRLGF